MAEITSIEKIVDAAVSRILEARIPLLREELVRTVAEELLPEMEKSQGLAASGESSQGGSPADLLAAISTIHAGTTQKEILRALLHSTTRYSGRSALFVIKSGMATGWQGRGFENSDAIKDFSLDLRSGIAARVMQDHVACQGTAAEMDARFVTHFRAPADGQALLLPLLLKDKIAALVYVDAGAHAGASIDASTLELLVVTTSAWLEVISLRKQSHKEGVPEISEKPESAASASAAAIPSSISDPFASHSPSHAPASAMKQPIAEPAPMAMAASAPDSGVGSGSVAPPLSADDEDTHRKAQRFARLLMDEIKLYNQSKVIEGRRSHDLYDRLKEDVDKSRATYQKRYGNTAAAEGDYFHRELIHILAEDDASLLGVNYHHEFRK